MKAYPNNKTVYISDFIKCKHKKEELNSLEFQFLITYALYKYNRKANNKVQP